MKKVSVCRSHVLILTTFDSEIMITCIKLLALFPFEEAMTESFVTFFLSYPSQRLKILPELTTLLNSLR